MSSVIRNMDFGNKTGTWSNVGKGGQGWVVILTNEPETKTGKPIESVPV
jgi:hypothetical protein